MCNFFANRCRIGVYQTLRTNLKIVKSIVSRCLYALYIFAVWRVVVFWDNEMFWLILLVLLPLLIEGWYMAFKRQGNEFKWISPCLMIYLCGAIPCIWLWEIKSHDLRIGNQTVTNASNCAEIQGKSFCLAQEEWDLGLKQVILLFLILGKWIAPKGQMSRDEHSQLLLVYLGAGGDISEILDLTTDEKIQMIEDPAVIYMILGAWSLSLLQFSFVTTAEKEMPRLAKLLKELEEEKELDRKLGINIATSATSPVRKTAAPGPSSTSETKGQTMSGGDETPVCCLPCYYDRQLFCLHNEIWSMIVGLLFQDVPFLAVRLTVMIRFDARSLTTIFFAFKNAVVVVLLLNRIRTVIGSEKRSWLHVMTQARHQRLQRMSGVDLQINVDSVIANPKFVLQS